MKNFDNEGFIWLLYYILGGGVYGDQFQSALAHARLVLYHFELHP
jgi:hypothetical protein